MKNLFKKYEDSHPIKPMEESLKNIEFNEYQKNEKVSTYQETKIKDKRRRNIKRGLVIATCTLVAILLVPVVGVLMIGLQYKDSFSYNKKQFSSSEMSRIDTNGIKAYNEMKYSTRKSPEHLKVDEEFVNDINNFTYQVFNDGLGIKNYGFASLSLYSHLDILSTLASPTYQGLFDEVLGDSFTRESNLNATYKNNFFFDSPRRASLMYNGLFVDKSLTLKDEIVPKLTDKHAEAYSLDLENKAHQDQMLKWVNEHSYGQDLNIKDLNLDSLSSFYLFSSMYFSSMWEYEYDEKNNRMLEFTSLDGTKTQKEFMNHSILSNVYDYGTYLSFYDYYNYYSIQYLTPMNKENSIFDLVDEVNFLVEDEAKHAGKKPTDYIPVDLTMPKFETNAMIDLEPILSKGPLSPIYQDSNKVFNAAFKEENLDPIYIDFTKQNNKIIFDEEGTTVSNLIFSLGAGSAAPSPEGGYEVTLDSPFIYVIRDMNNIPIFIGEYSYAK